MLNSMPVSTLNSTLQASYENNIDPIYGISYLLSEHQAGRYSGKCSEHGACGDWQLTPLWQKYAVKKGFIKQSDEDLRNSPKGAYIWIAHWTYSTNKHGIEKARWKMKGCKEDCWSARNWKKFEKKVRKKDLAFFHKKLL